MTTAERIKTKLVKAMAEKDLLNADYLLKMEILDEDIAKLQNELDNLETYGDMALVAEQTEPTSEDCSMVYDEDLGVPYVEVNGRDADCPWK